MEIFNCSIYTYELQCNSKLDVFASVVFCSVFSAFDNHALCWRLGHVDPGESDMETAMRETQEEAGFVSSDMKIFENAKQEMTYNVNGVPKIVIYWLAELLDPDKSVKLSNEHRAFEWLPLREARDLAKYPEMQKALNEFDKYINENIL